MAKIIEISRVTPFSDNSPEYPPFAAFSLPLTLFDTFWFKFPPVERLLFFSLPESSDTLLIPRLKHSLSLTLRNFLPLAGTLTWPEKSPKPLILYRAPNDAVSLSIAESEAENFDDLIGDHPRKASIFHSLIPELSFTETGASVVSLQVTVFPGKGFCVGLSNHHAILDGKSVTMFLKSWAHICRQNSPSLPPELTPFFDRSNVVKDPIGLDMLFLNQWSELFRSEEDENDSDPRHDPKLFEHLPLVKIPLNMLRATFHLSRSNVAKLRRDIITSTSSPEVRFSTFVVAFSYTFLCLARAAAAKEEKLIFGFSADFRSRLKPPVPENFFGNCIGFVICQDDDVAGEDAELASVAVRVDELVMDLGRKDDVMEGAEEWMQKMAEAAKGPARCVGVAGSPRFGVYDVDFGWGPPRKVEIASIDRTGAISMTECRDGSGGVEIGVVLEEANMEIFASRFVQGLQN